jgi:probable phosphoglycerate mutase
MTVLVLVRHAHTDSAGKRLTGRQRGVHLNARGREEAAALARRLEGVPVRAIYSSPLERCRETAAPLARALGITVRARGALLEVDYGDWTGRPIAGVRRTRLWRVVQHAPSRIRFPGGESLHEVQARAVAEVERIAVEHPRDVVAVVTHADVVRLVIAHYSGMHLDHLQRLVVDPASASVLVLDEGTARLVKVNDTGGLDALKPRRGVRPRVGG